MSHELGDLTTKEPITCRTTGGASLTYRPGLPGARGLAAARAAAHLCVRTHRLRRGGNRGPGRERPAARRDQD